MDVRQTCFWSEKAASRLRLCELPGTEHPLARLQRFGPGALSTAELIELVVGASEALGREVVSRFEDLEGLARAGLTEVAALKGVGIARAARIQAAFELGRRLAIAPLLGLAPQIRSPADAANLLISTMSLLEQETLRALVLDTRNRLVADVLVYQGNVSGSMVRVAEVYREAIRRNAPSILVAHNHPSGDIEPSPQDVEVTKQMVAAGQMLNIALLDHLIIGRGRWTSMRERGLGFGQ